MVKYHNSPKGPRMCRAEVQDCPYGAAGQPHFATIKEATAAYEQQLADTFGVVPKRSFFEESRRQFYGDIDNIVRVTTAVTNVVRERREALRTTLGNLSDRVAPVANPVVKRVATAMSFAVALTQQRNLALLRQYRDNHKKLKKARRSRQLGALKNRVGAATQRMSSRAEQILQARLVAQETELNAQWVARQRQADAEARARQPLTGTVLDAPSNAGNPRPSTGAPHATSGPEYNNKGWTAGVHSPRIDGAIPMGGRTADGRRVNDRGEELDAQGRRIVNGAPQPQVRTYEWMSQHFPSAASEYRPDASPDMNPPKPSPATDRFAESVAVWDPETGKLVNSKHHQVLKGKDWKAFLEWTRKHKQNTYA